jgi:hypothetical protein
MTRTLPYRRRAPDSSPDVNDNFSGVDSLQ